jgi:hypothetical protein
VTVLLNHPTAVVLTVMSAAAVVGLVIGFVSTPRLNVPEKSNEPHAFPAEAAHGSSTPEG